MPRSKLKMLVKGEESIRIWKTARKSGISRCSVGAPRRRENVSSTSTEAGHKPGLAGRGAGSSHLHRFASIVSQRLLRATFLGGARPRAGL